MEEIKYYYDDKHKLIFGIDNPLVDRDEFATAKVVEIQKNTFNNPEYNAAQSKNTLKVDFLSPLFGSTKFVYERSLNPGRS